MRIARKVGLLMILLTTMLVASWSRKIDDPPAEAAAYRTASVKFDYLNSRLEWEMRITKQGEPAVIDSYYVDLARGVMGHDGQETPVNAQLWKAIVGVFQGLDGLAVDCTKVWYGLYEPADDEKVSSPVLQLAAAHRKQR